MLNVFKQVTICIIITANLISLPSLFSELVTALLEQRNEVDYMLWPCVYFRLIFSTMHL